MHRDSTSSPDRAAATEIQVRTRIARELEAHGLKPTRQRLLIAVILLRGPRHLTAEQILLELKAGGRRVSKATVYNTLKALGEHGLIRQINLGSEHAVYDSTCTPHHHFHNVDTGELVDIPVEEVDFLKLPPAPAGTEAASIEVVIRVRQRPE